MGFSRAALLWALGLLLGIATTDAQSTAGCPLDYVCFGFDTSSSVRPFLSDQAAAMRGIAQNPSLSRAQITAFSMVDVYPDPAVLVTPFVSSTDFQGVDLSLPGRTGDDISTTIKACGDALKDVQGNRVMILVTDGRTPGLLEDHLSRAKEYKDMGISIFTIGTGDSPKLPFLRQVATSSDFFVRAKKFAAITAKFSAVLSDPSVCDQISSMSSSFRCQRKNCRFRLTRAGAIADRLGEINVGIVGGGGEALIRDGKDTIPISSWRPAGLKQAFSPSFFKPFPLAGTFMSGVGFEVQQQNQDRRRFLDERFVCLPLRAYQVLNDEKPPQVIENVNTNDPADCVFFMGMFPDDDSDVPSQSS